MANLSRKPKNRFDLIGILLLLAVLAVTGFYFSRTRGLVDKTLLESPPVETAQMEVSPIPTPEVSNQPTATKPPVSPVPPPVKEVYYALTGIIYRDENCNGVRDNNEGLVIPSATVNLFDTSTNSVYVSMNSGGGTFSYAGYIKENKTLTLQPRVVSPYGYKSNPHFKHPSFTFSSTAVLAQFQIPQVPAEFVGSCFPQ